MRNWPTVRLADVLRHRKEFIVIDDLAIYKRPRVQLHAQGVVLRDEITGALIKTKDQQVCHAREFLVAEIDAKVGGYGIVPEALEGAIVSSHYFLFVPDPSRLDYRFLEYFIRTPAFNEQVLAQGSTNYAAIRPSDVLNYEIPLPKLDEQQRIVAGIEKLVTLVQEARSLRRQATDEIEAFVVSTHIRLAGERVRKLSEVLILDEDQVEVTPTGEYPQVGVRGFGGGLFAKAATLGTETTYRAFNRLYEGAIVLSQVKGWEGAIAVCEGNLVGRFASPEYRTFRCVPGEASSRYLSAVFRTEWFWNRLAGATRGVGARRERTRPEQFLGIELPMPVLENQKAGEHLFAELASVTQLQNETGSEIDAIIPSFLNKTFQAAV